MVQVWKIIEGQLAGVFEAVDAENKARLVAWGLERKAAIVEFKASDEGRALRKDQWAYYGKLFALAGGKGWYKVFNDHGEAGVQAAMEKHAELIAAARRQKIAAKLAAFGVGEIEKAEYARSADGFQGVWIVQSDKGRVRVEIDVIYAGGYNIQILHQRVLVKVKIV